MEPCSLERVCQKYEYFDKGCMVVDEYMKYEDEEYAIATVAPPPPPELLQQAMEEVHVYLQEVVGVAVLSACFSPFGVGLFQFASVIVRDSLVLGNPYELDPHHSLRLIKHDEAHNLRNCNFNRICWILFLGFPLDYQSPQFIISVVAPYGKVLQYQDNGNFKSRVLVKVLAVDVSQIPRSLLVTRSTELGGNRRSDSPGLCPQLAYR